MKNTNKKNVDKTMLDYLILDNKIAALIMKNNLEPIQGDGGVIFPPTYAKFGYPINNYKSGGNQCIIDEVASQSNRLEPIFSKPGYKDLVQQIDIKYSDKSKSVSIFEATHRITDAILNFSNFRNNITDILKKSSNNDAEELVKLAPTSCIFGFWDSRLTGIKKTRIYQSDITAFDVDVLERHGQYTTTIDYREEGIGIGIGIDTDIDKNHTDDKNPVSKLGMNPVPIKSHGGVIARGGIKRTQRIMLQTLREWKCDNDDEKTLNIQRYLLGLSLICMTYELPLNLRSGCNLIQKEIGQICLSKSIGGISDEILDVNHEQLIEYVKCIKKELGISEEVITVEFDKNIAQAECDSFGSGKGKKTTAKKGKVSAEVEDVEAAV